MRVRVTIDKERCIGCGLCEENLPDLFAIGDFTAHVRTNPVDRSEELEATAGDCPTQAISLSEAGGERS